MRSKMEIGGSKSTMIADLKGDVLDLKVATPDLEIGN